MPRVVDGFSRAQRGLHWWSAILIATGFALGFVMVAVPLRDLLSKFLLFQAHKTVGLIVLCLTAWRLGLRISRGRPPQDTSLTPWEHQAARLGQILLYTLLLAVPVLGYLTACVAPSRVPTLFLLVIRVPSILGPDRQLYRLLRMVHRAAAFMLVGLAVAHAFAALRHHLNGRAVLRRMWRG